MCDARLAVSVHPPSLISVQSLLGGEGLVEDRSGLGGDVAAGGAQGVADGPHQCVVAVRDRLVLDPGVPCGGQDMAPTFGCQQGGVSFEN